MMQTRLTERFYLKSPFVGEGVGMINKVQPATEILNDMVAGAKAILDKQAGRYV